MKYDNLDAIMTNIIKIIEKKGALPDIPEEMIATYRPLESGHIDSFSLMGFIIDIEDTFDIELSPEETQSEEFRTIGGIAELIEKKHA